MVQPQIELAVVAALLVASVVGMLAQRLRLPYTVSLVLAGLGLAVLRATAAPGFDPGLHLTPQLLFLVLLPVLVFEAAFHMELEHFRANWRPIVALAVPGVLSGIVLTVALGWGTFRLLGLAPSLPVLLLAATILAATDPVGVLALLREVGAPRRLAVVMEGESLLNDAIAIVAFGVVLVGLGLDPHHQLSVGWVLRFLTWEVGEAVLIGGILGTGLSWLTAQVDDHLIEITLTTIGAFGSFVVADLVHASGVIACLVAGILSGNFGARYGMSSTTRVAVTSFWEYAAFAANSIIFLLIGLEISVPRLLQHLAPILALWIILLVARGVFVGVVIPLVVRRRNRPPKGFNWVLTWGGLRGGVAMVLALSVPRSFAGRAEVIDLVFGVSLLTILVQAPLTAPLLRLVGLAKDRAGREAVEELGARLRALHAASAYLLRQMEGEAVSEEVGRELEQELAARRQALRDRAEDLERHAQALRREEAQVLRRQLAVVEKEAVREAWAEGLLDERVMRRLVGEIDHRLFRLQQQAEEELDHGENGADA
jgi:CPA1 family monovalent cation:H+ antiporter